jgi:hypothetical protein
MFQCTQSSSAERIEVGKEYDFEKAIAQAEELEKNSALTKCFADNYCDE